MTICNRKTGLCEVSFFRALITAKCICFSSVVKKILKLYTANIPAVSIKRGCLYRYTMMKKNMIHMILSGRIEHRIPHSVLQFISNTESYVRPFEIYLK